MALVTAQAIKITGDAITYTAPTASDTVQADDRAFWHVKAGATATTFTVVVPGSKFGQPLPDVVVGPLTSTDRFIGPLTVELADPSTGLVTLLTSQQTGVTAAVVRI